MIQHVASLPGHHGPAWSVAWNPTLPLLASAGTDKSVRLYTYTTTDTANLSFHYAGELATDHKRTVRSIAWSPNGKTLATGSFDSTVGIWEQADDSDITAWECITTLEGHESECKSVAWSSDGALLASCSRDKSVWIWEVQDDGDFECISVLMEHSQDVKSIAWHPSLELLVSASYDASMLVYADDPDSDWCPIQRLAPPGTRDEAIKDDFVPPLQDPETVWSVAFSPDGQLLASGGDSGQIRVWSQS